ncbi:MAG: type I DNA topoisomerase [Armatimonadetes bacterium]|nr:type I DNA topoisomerase [Armatimonadota bacterium]
MASTLVIVESPAKARSLSKFLGKKYTVKASLGHVRDLPKSELGVKIKENFQPKYITIRGKGEIIKELKNAAKKVEKVYLAPDPDREGEAIAWHLMDVLQIEKDRPCRIEFNEITKQAVQKAIKNPRPIDANRVNSQQARRILDRLVGYSLSPLLWQKVKKGLSAGRVQSVAVRLICDREEEIQAFVPEEYWTLTAILQGKKGRPLEARLFKIGEEKAEIPDRTRLEEILKELTGAAFQVSKISRQEKARQPAPPFTTSTLQQEAYRKLNFTARRTMAVAQQLYEGLDLGEEGPVGLVTYIRTDSTRVADSAQAEARSYIQERFGPEYIPAEPRKAAPRGKIQDAHEAIRPTSLYREPETVKKYLTQDQYRLYKLIWSRFLAGQMGPALIETTSVDIAAGKYTFRAAGSVVRFPGFMRVYTESRDDSAEGGEEGRVLPELREGDRLTLKAYDPRQHFTQPPPRYTDATLVKTLEEKGIGRPSTYAPIVETIQKRGYVVRENRQFVPTELGIIVVNLLKKHFPDIIDVEFTATVEEKLDRIEEGELDWMQMLAEFYYPFQETVARAGEEIRKIELADEVTGEICEECGRRMVIKMGRYGKFLACPGFPECHFTKPLVTSTGIPCPQCPGELVERRSKKGRRFHGCSRYPECDFVVFDPPSREACPECGGLMVVKGRRDGVERLKCINENCGFQLEKEAGDNGEAREPLPAAGHHPGETIQPKIGVRD